MTYVCQVHGLGERGGTEVTLGKLSFYWMPVFQQQQLANVQDVTGKRCYFGLNTSQFLTTSNSMTVFQYARDPKVLSPGHPKCWTMVVKRSPAVALNSLLLAAWDVERNPGPTQPCYACGGEITSKGPECVKCGVLCHKKCSSLTRAEAAKWQRLDFFVCNHCNSSAGDQERCSVCRKGIRLHQYRAICNVCNSPCHLVYTLLPRNDRDKLNNGDKEWTCCSHRPVTSQPPQSFSSPSRPRQVNDWR